MKRLLVAFALLTVASCRDSERPAATGEEEKFVRAYARLVLSASEPRDPSRPTPERVLSDAGMTPEEFRKHVAEYNRDPQRWGPFIEKVQKVVEEAAASPAAPDSNAARS